MRIMCRLMLVQRFITVSAIFLLASVSIAAQSTRPRRTNRPPAQTTKTPADDPLLRPEPQPSPTARRTSSNDSLLDVQPVRPVANTVAPADTKHAYTARTETVCGRGQGGQGARGVASQRPGGLEDRRIRGVEPQAVCGCSQGSRESHRATAYCEAGGSKHGECSRAGVRSFREIPASAAAFDCGDQS